MTNVGRLVITELSHHMFEKVRIRFVDKLMATDHDGGGRLLIYLQTESLDWSSINI